MTAILEKIAFYWTYPFVRYALIVGVLIIQPMQFLRVPHTLLYCGKLREYVSNTCSEGICEDATNRTVHRRLP